MFPQCLLPSIDGLQLETIQSEDHTIALVLTTTSPSAICPLCHQPATRVHSRYRRTVADLPWAGINVRLHLNVRRFFCDTRDCTRRVFAERLGAALPASARRTTRLLEALRNIAFTGGGEGGARLAHGQAMPASPRTLLRLLQTALVPPFPPARVVGIDEWAWKKGRTYGTIVVDLEQKRPVDLLPDREVKSVVSWFKAHPGVEIIARDRSGLYAQAALQGAPSAVQVADRFHLVHNLVEALERFFLHKRSVLKAVHTHQQEEERPASSRAVPVMEGRASSQAAQSASLRRHAQSVELYEKIHALQAKKVDVATIARQVGVSRETVYRYLRMHEPPARTQIRSPRQQLIEPYKPYLIGRWNEGCRNAQQMYREICERGYTASMANVSRFIGQLRKDSGRAGSFKQVPASSIYAWTGERTRPLTALQAARLLVSREEKLPTWQKQVLLRLEEVDQEIGTMTKHVHDFLQMVRQLQGDRLDAWLEDTERDGIAELRAFAQSLRKDYAAVKAGLTLSWNNGPTEAQIQRLKLLKRQMYGQAGFALLRQRVLRREAKLKTRPRKSKRVQQLAA